MVVRGTNNFKAWQSGTLVFRLLRFLFSPVSSHFFLLTQLCTSTVYTSSAYSLSFSSFISRVSLGNDKEYLVGHPTW